MNNSTNEETCWQFSFDLNMQKLDEYYRKNRSNAYKEIKKYLESKGFNNKDDKQGSCYFTENKMTLVQVDKIISTMFRQLAWFPECASRVNIAKISTSEYNYIGLAQRINKSKKHKEDLAKYHRSITKKSKSR